MFTGIVEELGTVVRIEDQGDAQRLTFAATEVLAGARLGDSIAVNGCCLTIAALEPEESRPGAGRWTADVMAETLARTSIGGLAPGDRVNLERAMAVGDRLGGHIVQGHVDAVGTVLRRVPSEHWEVVEVGFPAALSRYLVEKGSITVDGTSLTVVSVTDPGAADPAFTISLIPETLARTTLGFRQPGDRVNLEVDILAKHVERLLAHQAQPQGSTHE
ncbi:riboflavin synthase [Nocardioides limicola]|uniref:riboflavin synthase n=1 Tax=Nocardioides limicola TaxID=2803368 RepID=UPI00193B0628|nr:riboflavin synthase [Nocardioides sp. DJM-14]